MILKTCAFSHNFFFWNWAIVHTKKWEGASFNRSNMVYESINHDWFSPTDNWLEITWAWERFTYLPLQADLAWSICLSFDQLNHPLGELLPNHAPVISLNDILIDEFGEERSGHQFGHWTWRTETMIIFGPDQNFNPGPWFESPQCDSLLGHIINGQPMSGRFTCPIIHLVTLKRRVTYPVRFVPLDGQSLVSAIDQGGSAWWPRALGRMRNWFELHIGLGFGIDNVQGGWPNPLAIFRPRLAGVEATICQSQVWNQVENYVIRTSTSSLFGW